MEIYATHLFSDLVNRMNLWPKLFRKLVEEEINLLSPLVTSLYLWPSVTTLVAIVLMMLEEID